MAGAQTCICDTRNLTSRAGSSVHMGIHEEEAVRQESIWVLLGAPFFMACVRVWGQELNPGSGV